MKRLMIILSLLNGFFYLESSQVQKKSDNKVIAEAISKFKEKYSKEIGKPVSIKVIRVLDGGNIIMNVNDYILQIKNNGEIDIPSITE